MSGSLRQNSYNRVLLEAAVTAARCAGDVEVVVWAGLADIPAYNEDLDAIPEPVAELRAELAAADAVLISTPEYNASVSGALKNALDWASRPYPANA